MKIAYLTPFDATDIYAWSGTANYMFRTLQDISAQTENIGNLKKWNIWGQLSILKKIYYTYLRSQQYLRYREPGLLKYYASQIQERLVSVQPDIVFSQGTVPVAYLDIDKPIVFWTDSTFAGMIDFNPEFTNLCTETIKNGNKMEQLALSKCCIAIYSSKWAANTAIQYYDVDPAKVKIVPFGANVDSYRDQNEINKIIEKKSSILANYFLLGVDWHMKGGKKALAVAKLLNKWGLRTELHIAGCKPPFSTPSFVKSHGFISKKPRKDGSKSINYIQKLIF